MLLGGAIDFRAQGAAIEGRNRRGTHRSSRDLGEELERDVEEGAELPVGGAGLESRDVV